MDIISILSGIAPFALFALIAIFIAIFVSVPIYSICKKRNGKRTLTKGKLTVSFLILGWFIVVMGLTTFSRAANYEGFFNFRLFSGYVSAWHNWSLKEFQLIIFNMLLFVPLGFLLPLLGKSMRRFMPVSLISLAVTIGIEVLQLLSRRGIFELDDILHNTVGSISGYFLVMAFLAYLERKQKALKPVFMAMAIPLVFTAVFSVALFVYHSKELGNMSIRPAAPQNMNLVKVELTTLLPTTAEPVSLYRNDSIHNVDQVRELASLISKSFGLRQKGDMRTDSYNRIYNYEDDAGVEYNFNYQLDIGSWSLRKENCPTENLQQEALLEQRAGYEKLLASIGLLPAEAVFSTQNENILRWDGANPTEISKATADYVSGGIIITPSMETESPCEIHYFMNDNNYVKQVDIISPAQAYEEIEKGNFESYNDHKAGDHLTVESYSLTYLYDSKGYYQPAYEFNGTFNGEPWSWRIPAITS
ncbi:VanZ family protein [Cytobacillus firmus]|uniref:VanZ family protein n=1 Tax=Cytobacillus firmus TaxID=1399 RepID=UPI0021C9CABB|nr:VanZ family protein [Cytobacillus firmus]MCU1806421.1 VanZ family protein [Cytobacillus firmus]